MDKKRKITVQGGDFKTKKRKRGKSVSSSSDESKNKRDFNCHAWKTKIRAPTKFKKQDRQKLFAVEKTNDKKSASKMDHAAGPLEQSNHPVAKRSKKITPPSKKKQKMSMKKEARRVNSNKNSGSNAEMRTTDTGNAEMRTTDTGNAEMRTTDSGNAEMRTADSGNVKQNDKTGTGKKNETKPAKKLGGKTVNTTPKTKVTVPSGGTEMSSNWKSLAATLNINTEKKASGQAKVTEKSLPMKIEEKSDHEGESPEIWFDDVDPVIVHACANTKVDLQSRNLFQGLTMCLALDCEMVGAGLQGKDNELARVSLVNQYGACVYDKYVKPREKVTDYRTAFSGIKPEHIKKAEVFDTVQKEVADLLKGRILVGHALHNDMKVLFLSHPSKYLRDTARYKPFRTLLRTNRPGLKRLAREILHVSVQEGEHSSVEDAQAAMKLYTLHKKDWDAAVSRYGNKANTWTKEKKSQLSLLSHCLHTGT